MRTILLSAGAVLLGLSSAAAAPSRDLPVPAGKAWQHADTQLILPPSLGGLQRTSLVDLGDSERDVVAEFTDAKRAIVATVSLFHPAIDSVALWFDRAQAQVEARNGYGGSAPTSAEPLAFAPPYLATKSALRRSYTAAKGASRRTGLAVLSLNGWLVAIRLSATDLTAPDLDRRMDAVIAAIRWPSSVPPAMPAAPLVACRDPLRFEQAKVAGPKDADVLASLMSATATANPRTKPAERSVTWCRDSASTPPLGIYRDRDGGQGYEIGVGDAGEVVHVAPSLDMMTGNGKGYTVSLTRVDGTTNAFPSFDGLPAPMQVMALVHDGGTGSATMRSGETDVRLPSNLR